MARGRWRTAAELDAMARRGGRVGMTSSSRNQYTDRAYLQTRYLYQAAQAVQIPICGVGGISDAAPIARST